MVEFEGTFNEEYNIYKPAKFLITACEGARVRELLVHAEYGVEGWEILAGTTTDMGADPWLITTSRGKYDTPQLTIAIRDGERVRVRLIAGGD